MDGFRALAHVQGHRCTLVSRNGHIFKSWRQLAEEIAYSVRAHPAILEGEICCLNPSRHHRPSLESRELGLRETGNTQLAFRKRRSSPNWIHTCPERAHSWPAASRDSLARVRISASRSCDGANWHWRARHRSHDRAAALDRQAPHAALQFVRMPVAPFCHTVAAADSSAIGEDVTFVYGFCIHVYERAARHFRDNSRVVSHPGGYDTSSGRRFQLSAGLRPSSLESKQLDDKPQIASAPGAVLGTAKV